MYAYKGMLLKKYISVPMRLSHKNPRSMKSVIFVYIKKEDP